MYRRLLYNYKKNTKQKRRYTPWQITQKQTLEKKRELNITIHFLNTEQNSASTIFRQELTYLSYTLIRTMKKFTASFPVKEKSLLTEKKLLSLQVIG